MKKKFDLILPYENGSYLADSNFMILIQILWFWLKFHDFDWSLIAPIFFGLKYTISWSSKERTHDFLLYWQSMKSMLIVSVLLTVKRLMEIMKKSQEKSEIFYFLRIFHRYFSIFFVFMMYRVDRKSVV